MLGSVWRRIVTLNGKVVATYPLCPCARGDASQDVMRRASRFPLAIPTEVAGLPIENNLGVCPGARRNYGVIASTVAMGPNESAPPRA
jgi:hypothetical protein